MTRTQKRKQAIRAFLRTPVWTDEKLCALLAHAESKLAFKSCCCLIGTATADHALRGANDEYTRSHYMEAIDLPKALEAEIAYKYLTDYWNDGARRRILRPIIRAELKRREHLRIPVELESKQELVYATI